MCCGKGGDLKKWEKVQATHYLGIDIAESSIADAKVRCRSMRSKMRPFFDVADCFHSPLFIKSDGKSTSNGQDKDPFLFDIISCMFSFHYAFENESSVRMALENIARHLKPNGIFIITIPKASVIEQLKIQALAGDSKPYIAGNSLFEVEFGPEDSIGKDKPPVNNELANPCNESNFSTIKYFFSLKEAVNKCPEFSVSMEVLFPIAASLGLICESEMDFLTFYYDYKDDPTYSALLDIFGLVNRTDHQLRLNQEELETISRAKFYLIYFPIDLYAALAFVKK